MAFLAVDKNETEFIYDGKPFRKYDDEWGIDNSDANYVQLPKGSIAKLIGRELTWSDEPYELKD